MKAPELPALTGIRFFAASLVFLDHSATLPGETWSAVGFFSHHGLGNFGVAVFFVLSGFILTYNYARWFGSGINPGNYGRFIWDRLAKIYPLYLLTLLMAIPIELAGHHRDWSWGALVMQLTLLQCILPVDQLSATNHFNVPAWSISCEMFFYLLAPVLIWLGLSFKRLAFMVTLGWLAAFSLAVTAGIWAMHVSAWPARFAPARAAEFIVGVVTAVCYLKGRIPQTNTIRLCVAGGFILLVLSVIVPNPATCLRIGFLSSPGAALLIYGLAYGQGWLAQFLSHRWLVLLGMASFAFYLIHDLIFRVFRGIFEHYHISASSCLTTAAIIVILFVLTQFLSICLMKMVEVPTQKYLRSLVRRKNPAASVDAGQTFAATDQRP